MKKSIAFCLGLVLLASWVHGDSQRPHIVLVMTDDQGWGQVGYRGHPHLKTPNLDAMAANGLRFDRYYAGASNCSPTRATVLTGRTNDRTGVENHGYTLRKEERTVAQMLQEIGYATGHFGKWHLNGLRGPGVPILKEDTHGPGGFGFETWLSVTNFFDLNPILSRGGDFEEFGGDSSEIIVSEALKFIADAHRKAKPSFSVIWYGSPHDPMWALEKDRAPFADLPEKHQNHLGELVAMDRSVGHLRSGLREMGIADNTLVWFSSDNGGLSPYGPETVGGLRGWKNTMYEGGIRVPGIIEWPAEIKPRVTSYIAGTVDILPTLAEIVGAEASVDDRPLDGISLKPLFATELKKRRKPLGFRHQSRGVWLDGDFKFLTQKGQAVLYHLGEDPTESTNVAGSHPEVFQRMKREYGDWETSVEKSVQGKDYPEGKVDPNQPERRFWTEEKAYESFFDAWKERPEYASRLQKRKK